MNAHREESINREEEELALFMTENDPNLRTDIKGNSCPVYT